MEQLTDVWELETPDEKAAEADLRDIVDAAFEGDTTAQEYLRLLWTNESWESIKAKLETESSAWYVWYMYGIRQHLKNNYPDLIKKGGS